MTTSGSRPPPLGDGGTLYTFYDFERSTPLIVLVLLFVAAVVALGRWRGVGALAGLAASLLVIVWFALPSLVDGNNAVAVALVTAGAIAILALYLAHGVGPATDVALLSTFASLALTGILAWIFVETAQFTGLHGRRQLRAAVARSPASTRAASCWPAS